MNQNFNHKPFASGRVRALITILLLATGAVCGALSIIINFALGGMLRDVGDLTAPDEIGEALPELLYVGIALLQFLVFIATAVAFLMWLHRAYRNLRALGAMGLDTTPGWAVGYFFIPILNLFKPFQVMKEIWRNSTPGSERQASFGGQSGASFGGGYVRPGTPALIGWWWAFWIIATIADRASSRAARMARTIEGMMLASWVSIASDALFIIAAVLAILLVKQIDEMQETKFRQMGLQGPPPPPENFDTQWYETR
ncbi:MAG TPA: DUF4328 domain-containing protein [Pyrinomonadaceae bacterium]|nr:DUF4328 domain-containing protein [Pyrinomonadaceae bacterium]